MIPRIRPRSTASLSTLRNAGTRIYAAGADPKFRRPVSAPTFRLVPAFADAEQGAGGKNRLWRPEMIDRLQPPLTRYPE